MLGVNYYTSQLFRAGQHSSQPTPHPAAPDAVAVDRPELPRTDMGWEASPRTPSATCWSACTATTPVRPAVFRWRSPRTARRSTTPDPASGPIEDTERIDYLVGHLSAVHQAIEAGAQIDTYLVWSLIDNFEWAFGYTKRFGLVAVDEALNRVPKASAGWYSELVRHRYADAAGAGLERPGTNGRQRRR